MAASRTRCARRAAIGRASRSSWAAGARAARAARSGSRPGSSRGSACRARRRRRAAKRCSSTARRSGERTSSSSSARSTRRRSGSRRDVLALAAGFESRVLLWECMALQPKYVENLSVAAGCATTYSTLTNAYPDHEDIQGPSGIDVATVISGFMPPGGKVFTTEDPKCCPCSASGRESEARVLRRARGRAHALRGRCARAHARTRAPVEHRARRAHRERRSASIASTRSATWPRTSCPTSARSTSTRGPSISGARSRSPTG